MKRNVLALAGVERLPPDLADMTIGEFANLLDSGFQREAVAIFTRPDWRIGDRLLPRLKDVAEIHREGFARILYSDGYDIDVPGIKRPVPRPWRCTWLYSNLASVGNRGIIMHTPRIKV